MSLKPTRLLAVFALTLVLALPLSLSFSPYAQGQSEEEIANIVNKAKQFYDTENYEEAAPLLRQAAEQGNADAQRMLGVLYVKGSSVPKDQGLAVEWTRKAAEQGHGKALYHLGLFYGQGHGVGQDKLQSKALYILAVKQGYDTPFGKNWRYGHTEEEQARVESIVQEWEYRIEANK